MFTVNITTDAITEERKIELEEALEMALLIMTGNTIPDRPDWNTLAEALKQARGI